MTDEVTRPRLDEEEFGRLLLRIESDVHRGGWDAPPWVFVLVDADVHPDTGQGLRRIMRGSGPSIRVRGYLAQPILAGRFFTTTPGAPWEALRTFAVNLAYAEHENVSTVREVLRSPGVFGFVAVMTSWRTDDREALNRAIAGEVNLGDAPGSVESRHLVSVTTDGRVRTVTRDRGRKPELHLNEDHLRGDFSTSLRILCDMVIDDVPAPEEFDQRYPTLGEVAAQQK